VIVAATLNGTNLLITESLHQFSQFRVVVGPVLAYLIAGKYRIHLVVSVHGLVHTSLHDAIHIAGEQLIPGGAPDHLDHVPLGATEDTLQFLDDFAVTAHRTIEPLQVAVDHYYKVVQLFACSDIDRTQDFRLITFTVADKAPYFAAIGGF